MILGLALSMVGGLMVVGAPDVVLIAAVLLVGAQVVGDPGRTVFEINEVSLRQSVAAPAVMGRVNAGVRFAGLVAMLAGALLAAALVGPLGARGVLLAGVGAEVAAAATLAFSPVRGLRDHEGAEELAPVPAG
jgi:hypothetical protein